MNNENMSYVLAVLKMKPAKFEWQEEVHTQWYRSAIKDLPDESSRYIVNELVRNMAYKYRPEPCEVKAIWESRPVKPKVYSTPALSGPRLTREFMDKYVEENQDKSFFRDLKERRKKSSGVRESERREFKRVDIEGMKPADGRRLAQQAREMAGSR